MPDAEDAPKPGLAKKALAELLATFFVTLTATSVDILYYHGGHVDYVSRWLARGFIATVTIYAFSEISGAHANPVVTLAFFLRRTLEMHVTAVYVAVQMAGGFAAGALAARLWGSLVRLGASHPGTGYSYGVAAVAEVVLTFLVVITILATAEEETVIGKQSALAIGFAIATCGFFGGPISGASMNPARSIGPQIVGGQYDLIWVYALGPSAGAALAVIIAAVLLGAPRSGERKAAHG